MIYHLRYDAEAVKERIERSAEGADIAAGFIKLVLRATLSKLELDDLIEIVAKRTHRKVTQIRAAVKDAVQKQAERRKKEAQARQRAESNDYRPVIGRPSPDAPLDTGDEDDQRCDLGCADREAVTAKHVRQGGQVALPARSEHSRVQQER